jgi:hypothetical protein
MNAYNEKFGNSAGGHGKLNTIRKTFRGNITKYTRDMPFLRCSVRKETIQKLCKSIGLSTGPIYFVFCLLYPSTHGSVWVLNNLLIHNLIIPAVRESLVTDTGKSLTFFLQCRRREDM